MSSCKSALDLVNRLFVECWKLVKSQRALLDRDASEEEKMPLRKLRINLINGYQELLRQLRAILHQTLVDSENMLVEYRAKLARKMPIQPNSALPGGILGQFKQPDMGASRQTQTSERMRALKTEEERLKEECRSERGTANKERLNELTRGLQKVQLELEEEALVQQEKEIRAADAVIASTARTTLATAKRMLDLYTKEQDEGNKLLKVIEKTLDEDTFEVDPMLISTIEQELTKKASSAQPASTTAALPVDVRQLIVLARPLTDDQMRELLEKLEVENGKCRTELKTCVGYYREIYPEDATVPVPLREENQRNLRNAKFALRAYMANAWMIASRLLGKLNSYVTIEGMTVDEQRRAYEQSKKDMEPLTTQVTYLQGKIDDTKNKLVDIRGEIAGFKEKIANPLPETVYGFTPIPTLTEQTKLDEELKKLGEQLKLASEEEARLEKELQLLEEQFKEASEKVRLETKLTRIQGERYQRALQKLNGYKQILKQLPGFIAENQKTDLELEEVLIATARGKRVN